VKPRFGKVQFLRTNKTASDNTSQLSLKRGQGSCEAATVACCWSLLQFLCLFGRYWQYWADGNCDGVIDCYDIDSCRECEGPVPPPRACECLSHCDMSGNGFVSVADIVMLKAMIGEDPDYDGKIAECDNCLDVYILSRKMPTATGLGDACDPCPYDPLNDPDGDAWL